MFRINQQDLDTAKTDKDSITNPFNDIMDPMEPSIDEEYSRMGHEVDDNLIHNPPNISSDICDQVSSKPLLTPLVLSRDEPRRPPQV